MINIFAPSFKWISEYEVVDNEAVEDLDIFSKLIELMEIQTLLSDEDDRKDVILSIHPGAEVKILKIGMRYTECI